MDDKLEKIIEDHFEGIDIESDYTSFSSISVTEGFSRGFTIEHVERQLREGEIVNALILCSTLLEIVFARFIQKRFDITEAEFDKLWNRSSLGRYWQICKVVDALPKQYPEKEIQCLIEERNKLVHDAGYLDELMDSEEMKSEITPNIRKVLNYVNSIKLANEERSYSIDLDFETIEESKDPK